MQLALAPSILSKSQYARLKNVSAARVSQWISENKIEPDALVGEGRHQKIDVRKADGYLRKNLDIVQRTGLNGLSTRIDAAPPIEQAPLAAPATGPAPQPAATGSDPVEEQIKRERLEALQRDNRKRAEDEAARAGRYTPTDEIRAEIGKIGSHMLAVIEGSLTEIATALAGEFKIPQRDALHLLRLEMRKVRARAAASFAVAAEQLPELIEDEIAPATELPPAQASQSDINNGNPPSEPVTNCEPSAGGDL